MQEIQCGVESSMAGRTVCDPSKLLQVSGGESPTIAMSSQTPFCYKKRVLIGLLSLIAVNVVTGVSAGIALGFNSSGSQNDVSKPPTGVPTITPTQELTTNPSTTPTQEPTAIPTIIPTQEPTISPTCSPTSIPTNPGLNLDELSDFTDRLEEICALHPDKNIGYVL